jgi:L-lysine 6-transaminase
MSLSYSDVIPSLKRHVLVDGFHIVLDPIKSHDCIIYNGADNQEYLDFFSFFASLPLGFNHPKLVTPEFQKKIAPYALIKPSNSDVYSVAYAEFVEHFHNICVPKSFPHSFYIEGGGLAVENALKVAFDWKVRKNLSRNKGERGTMALHFKEAFHGRTGYTLSLTNTSSLEKTLYFPKFGWPRVLNPKTTFPLSNPDNLKATEALEATSKKEIIAAFDQHPDDIACILIETIQGEGGDNYFRPEFLKFLREVADEREALLIFDEVQTGFAASGSWWAFERMGVLPDIFCFGKKTQVCGIAASNRIDDEDNCFKVSSRINSTFGGSLIDMVRAHQFINIIVEDNLLAHAKSIGPKMISHLKELQQKYTQLSNLRECGTWIAFDLQDTSSRDKFYSHLLEKQKMVALKCGDKTIRMRTALNMPHDLLAEGATRIEGTLKHLS